jgi:hypothetical protein
MIKIGSEKLLPSKKKNKKKQQYIKKKNGNEKILKNPNIYLWYEGTEAWHTSSPGGG